MASGVTTKVHENGGPGMLEDGSTDTDSAPGWESVMLMSVRPTGYSKRTSVVDSKPRDSDTMNPSSHWSSGGSEVEPSELPELPLPAPLPESAAEVLEPVVLVDPVPDADAVIAVVPVDVMRALVDPSVVPVEPLVLGSLSLAPLEGSEKQPPLATNDPQTTSTRTLQPMRKS